MSTKGKTSKRRIRIPNKYKNTVCDLNENKLNANCKNDGSGDLNDEYRENEEIRAQNEELGVFGDNSDLNKNVIVDKGLEMRNEEVENVVVNENMENMNVNCLAEGSTVSIPTNSANNDPLNDGSNSCIEKVLDGNNHSAQDRNNNECNSEVKQYAVNKDNKQWKSYASVVETSVIDRNMCFIPTVISSEGNEVVIFDEELVMEGSKKWQFTICGQFVGYNMPSTEAKYNLRRMWNRYGLSEMISNDNGVWFFKFKDEVNMNSVIDQSPWMVNGKPLLVQKWSLEVCIEKAGPSKIPIWIKLFNVPLEAWTNKGISALSSRLGKPILMDSMTASMCQKGMGRIGFARVLVEIDAKKGFQDKIEVQYIDKLNNIVRTKFVNVEYTWKPAVCCHCSVFGHMSSRCMQIRRNGSQNVEENGKD